MWLLIILLALGFAVQIYVRAYLECKDSKRSLLIKRWKLAREERIEWRESYGWMDFNHPEYQRLWEIEIGAEDLYLLYNKGISYGISWSDYCFEKRLAEQETEE